MRAMFGLVSLLVVVAIIAFLFSMYDIPVAKQGRVTQQQARQLSGHDLDGTPADQTIKLDADLRNNKLADLIVTSVTPGGAMDRVYGFQAGDKIIAIGDMDISTLSNDDFEMAKAQLLQEGFEKGKPVTVIRNEKKIQLPLPGQAAAAAAAAPPPSSSGSTTPASPSESDPTEKSIIKQLQGTSDQK
jgi:hypothetical protein